MLPRSLLLIAITVASVGATRPSVQFRDTAARVTAMHPATIRPGKNDALSTYFTKGGWRIAWNDEPVGSGKIVVNFQAAGLANRHADYADVVRETVQIGMSRDPGVVARCGTTGLTGPNGGRLPNRMLGGHRWTVYSHGDAGMSQSVASLDYRTVIDGSCFAITRLTYRAGGTISFNPALPPASVATARIDAILNSIRIGRQR